VQVNKDGLVVQELQISPMGIITVIEPKNNDTDTRLGLDVMKLVRCWVCFEQRMTGSAILVLGCGCFLK
jgi:hypothetical protein